MMSEGVTATSGSEGVTATSGREVDAKLLWAVAESDCEVIKEALWCGADPNAVNVQNNVSALDAASTRDFHECVALLIEAGADINRVDKDGMTPTMGAAWFGASRSLGVLLGAGADPKHVESRRLMSALHLCCSDGLGEEARLLCEYGGFTEAKSVEGHSALDWAIKAGNHNLVEYLAPKFSLASLEETRSKWKVLADESADSAQLGVDEVERGRALESYQSAMAVADAKKLAHQMGSEVREAPHGRRGAI
jgi:hypothetical protein